MSFSTEDWFRHCEQLREANREKGRLNLELKDCLDRNELLKAELRRLQSVNEELQSQLTEIMRKSYFLQPGDHVRHVKDSSWVGRIKTIDWNLIDAGYGSTTCRVIWDDDGSEDIQWTTRLQKLEDEFNA